MAKNTDDDLTREDFDAGPSSYDEIESDLFLGNLTAATDIHWLKQAKISHILTVDSCPLPRKIQDTLPDIKLKYMQFSDMPREDLLTSFPNSNQFIESALESGGKVLVHCYFGVSRSATIVIAFIMRKYNFSVEKAFEVVKKKRRFVGPNAGFLAQFIEPLAWMPDILHNVDGKLNCPKCTSKLGSFSWIAGCQCPCGSKIAPAFYLIPSKVDWSNAVQNIQLTV